ncbi:MAG: hypothetical protein OXC40_01780 [Proteobacteria bacterium]|nr:hypothetical protein [Pseudomonadota bacterium]
MASATKITKVRRRLRRKNLGHKRKRQAKIMGTTKPLLPLDEAAFQ